MSDFYKYEQLLVVGYHGQLHDVVPRRVRPIYAVAEEPHRVVFLEAVFGRSRLRCSKETTREKLERTAQRGEVTLLPQPFAAQMFHSLWVDERCVPHYGPSMQVVEVLSSIAHRFVRDAYRATTSGDLDTALLCCDKATTAHKHTVNALALRAAILRHRGEGGAPAAVLRDAGLTNPQLLAFLRSVDDHALLLTEGDAACAGCADILLRDLAGWWRNKKDLPNAAQCPECLGWWEIANSGLSYGDHVYCSVRCQQRGCTEHARHRATGRRAKRRFRCDRHAGVCIVA